MSIGITSGAKTIPAAGSQPVQIATPATAQSVIVYFATTNVGPVYVGGSTVTAATGVPFPAGAYINIDVGDTGAIYLAGTENDTVRWLATGRVLPA